MSNLDDKLDREADRFAEHPVRSGIRWGVAVGIVILILIVVFSIGGFVMGWFNEAQRVASPANVRTQYHTVIEDWHAMQVAAGNYCGAKNSKTNANSPSLVEDPAFAYAAQYRHITIEYNEVQDNIFEAKLVGPKGYPQNAPTLDEMTQQVC